VYNRSTVNSTVSETASGVSLPIGTVKCGQEKRSEQISADFSSGAGLYLGYFLVASHSKLNRLKQWGV
jgi:hypothetical protein